MSIFSSSHCSPGERSSSMKDFSWWPKQSTWEASGMNVGFWSSVAEHWFQLHLSSILQGKAKPLTASKWKDALKLEKPTMGKMVRSLEKFTASKLDAAIADRSARWSFRTLSLPLRRCYLYEYIVYYINHVYYLECTCICCPLRGWNVGECDAMSGPWLPTEYFIC